MASEAMTLTKLMGKPSFQPAPRMDHQAEGLIRAHLLTRRQHGDLYPVSVDDLTTLIESLGADLDVYADLSSYGCGVEGVTLFRPRSRPSVRISAELSENHHQSRLKSTLAHEFGHVYLHDPMFQTRHQDGLFGNCAEGVQVSFRDGHADVAQSDLYEFQAWCFCRALLMPKSEVVRVVQSLVEQGNHWGDIWQGSGLGQKIITRCSDRFGVSEQLARIHLLRTGALTKAEPPASLF